MSCTHHPDYDPSKGEPNDDDLKRAKVLFSSVPCGHCWIAFAQHQRTTIELLKRQLEEEMEKLDYPHQEWADMQKREARLREALEKFAEATSNSADSTARKESAKARAALEGE